MLLAAYGHADMRAYQTVISRIRSRKKIGFTMISLLLTVLQRPLSKHSFVYQHRQKLQQLV